VDARSASSSLAWRLLSPWRLSRSGALAKAPAARGLPAQKIDDPELAKFR